MRHFDPTYLGPLPPHRAPSTRTGCRATSLTVGWPANASAGTIRAAVGHAEREADAWARHALAANGFGDAGAAAVGVPGTVPDGTA